MDIESEAGRKARIEAAQNALNDGSCGIALDLIDDLYNSEYSSNEVRQVYASAHGCFAQIEFFTMIDDIANNSADLGGTFFWEFISLLMIPDASTTSTQIEERLQAAIESSRALMAVLSTPISSVPEDRRIETDEFNPMATAATYRDDLADFYNLFVQMAKMSHIQQRYGDPNDQGEQGAALPWLSESSMSGTDFSAQAGCEYAASTLHFLEMMKEFSGALTGTSGAALANMVELLENGAGPIPGIGDACLFGCQSLLLDGVTPFPSDVATCSFTPAQCNPCEANDPQCISCPYAIRNPTECRSNPIARCAAAGIVRFMDLGWQDL